MKLLSLFLRIYFFAKFALVFPLYIYASSGIVRTFDTHTASVHVYMHDDRILFECRVVPAGAVDSLLLEIYVRAHVDVDCVVCCTRIQER